MPTFTPQDTRTKSPRLLELEAKLRTAQCELRRAESLVEDCEEEIDKIKLSISRLTPEDMDDLDTSIETLLQLPFLAGNELSFLERVRHGECVEKDDVVRLRELEGLHRFELIERERA